MRFTVLTGSVVLLSALTVTGCSGSGTGASPYAYNGNAQGYQQGYTQQGYAQNGYAQNGYGCPTGSQSTSYGYGYSNPSTGCSTVGSAQTNPYAPNSYAQGTYAVGGLRGTQPAYYGHDMYAQGTVLRGGAPYGAAAGAAGNGYYNYGQKPVKQSKAYVSLGAIDYNIGESAYGVQGRLGYNFSPLFGAELEVSTGVAKEFVGVGSSVGIDYSVGGFAVARAPLGSKFSLLARGGYHVTKFGVTTPAISGTVSMDGFALGLGAEYAFTPKNALRLDYTRYGMRQLGNSTGAASLSYVRKF